MGRLKFEMSVSLDGYSAGPDPSTQLPLGVGGDQLHEWAVATESWREQHRLDGGERSVDDDVIEESMRGIGATIMGRRMYSGGEGPWEEDPMASGWWGGEPPFRHPVFVLTHHAREPLALKGTTFTYVTDGIESALEQARAAAGELDVAIGGGANVAQQYLRAGLVDSFQLHVAPVLLGGGVRFFDDGLRTAADGQELECVRTLASPAGVAHLQYRVVRST